MANLDRLISIKGVWAAGEFSDDGKPIAYRSKIFRLCRTSRYPLTMDKSLYGKVEQKQKTKI